MLPSLLDAPPERVEIRGNLVYFFHNDGIIFAQPVDVALRTAAMLHAAIADWQKGLSDNVVTLEIRPD